MYAYKMSFMSCMDTVKDLYTMSEFISNTTVTNDYVRTRLE
jgi:hypothetical protein